MVIEFLAPQGWGALKKALDFIGGKTSTARPWVLLNVLDPHGPAKFSASDCEHLYLPAFSADLRRSSALKQLLWVYAPLQSAPLVTQKLLESSLCEGVLITGLDSFARQTPAALWLRRWQLASERGASIALWLHEKKAALIGVDLKLEWQKPGAFVVTKGRHLFDKEVAFGPIEKRQRISHSPAA